MTHTEYTITCISRLLNILTNIGLLDKHGKETLASFIIVIIILNAEFEIKVHFYSCSKVNQHSKTLIQVNAYSLTT